MANDALYGPDGKELPFSGPLATPEQLTEQLELAYNSICDTLADLNKRLLKETVTEKDQIACAMLFEQIARFSTCASFLIGQVLAPQSDTTRIYANLFTTLQALDLERNARIMRQQAMEQEAPK